MRSAVGIHEEVVNQETIVSAADSIAEVTPCGNWG